jgi:Holliday junction resolvase-like predicted endonuclease
MQTKKTLTAAEIGYYGERHATAWLTANGYSCYQNTQLPGSTDIDATSSKASLYVQVKTAVSPNSPAELSADERKAIVARANRNNRQAWLAQVTIDENGDLIGKITWTKLN